MLVVAEVWLARPDALVLLVEISAFVSSAEVVAVAEWDVTDEDCNDSVETYCFKAEVVGEAVRELVSEVEAVFKPAGGPI